MAQMFTRINIKFEHFINTQAELSFYYQVQFVKNFCYLRCRLNASGSEAAMKARTGIGWRVASWKKAFVENERTILSELCKVGNAVWEQDLVFEGERDGNFGKN